MTDKQDKQRIGHAIQDIHTLDSAKKAGQDVVSSIEKGEDSEEIVVVDTGLLKESEKRKKEIEKKEVEKHDEEDRLVTIDEALSAVPIVEIESKRERARVLVLTRDVSYLEAQKPFGRVKEMVDAFMEVHVIVLSVGREKKTVSRRVSEKFWVYPTNARSVKRTPSAAVSVAKNELSFGDGFRPDLIIAMDPFECGLAAYKISRRFRRKSQIHISDDFFSTIFKDADDMNSWRIKVAKKILKRSTCVRVRSEYLKNRVEENFKNLKGTVEVLPTYYDLNRWGNLETSNTLQELHPQFRFFILHVTSMNERSHTDRAMSGVARILKQYATACLVIVGSGPQKEMLHDHAENLGVASQIDFRESTEDIVSYMRSANVFLFTSENTEDEEVLFLAATSKIPIVCGVNGIASEIFIHEESALFCPLDNVPCFGKNVNKILNNVVLRNELKTGAYDVVNERVEQNYDTFLESYRGSIERCLVEVS